MSRPKAWVRWLSAAFVATVVSAHGIARACPGCASPREENREAFVDTTIFLSFLPLVMIGGFIWLLSHRAKRLQPAQQISVRD